MHVLRMRIEYMYLRKRAVKPKSLRLYLNRIYNVL